MEAREKKTLTYFLWPSYLRMNSAGQHSMMLIFDWSLYLLLGHRTKFVTAQGVWCSHSLKEEEIKQWILFFNSFCLICLVSLVCWFVEDIVLSFVTLFLGPVWAILIFYFCCSWRCLFIFEGQNTADVYWHNADPLHIHLNKIW